MKTVARLCIDQNRGRRRRFVAAAPAVGGKSLKEHLAATDHAQAVDFVRSLVDRGIRTVSKQEILKLQEIVLDGIDDANAGMHPVSLAAEGKPIGGCRAAGRAP